ncbi:polysaccharide lyase [Echinicola shivajiensis]|uniref:polysaccharide lyase n=1 Tax=Echinicola shivajiensis TaxID=1035916 RepID=UPI001BFCB314|nr:polysaccharide lyase [Echinicola shivajiensis]
MRISKQKIFTSSLMCAFSLGFYSCDVVDTNQDDIIESDKLYKATLSLDDLIYDISFSESSPLRGLTLQFAESHSYKVTSDPVTGSGKVARIELRDSDDEATKSAMRAEILFPDQNDNERWYSYSVYFPTSGYKKDSYTEAITQWHQSGAGSPPNAVQIEDDRIYLRTIKSSSITASQNEDKYYDEYDLAKVERGKWHTFTYHFIHSTGSSGLIEIWHNGKKVMSRSGGNMRKGYDQPRFKVGIYKWKWNYGKTTDTDKRVLYYDNIRIGDDDTSLSMITSGLNLSSTSTSSSSSESTESSSGDGVQGLTLVAANVDRDLVNIKNGQTYETSTHKLNIRANMPGSFVGKVKFELSGDDNRVYEDDGYPYSLMGDDGNNNYYFNGGIYPGEYTLKVTPYYGNTVKGSSYTVTFRITS